MFNFPNFIIHFIVYFIRLNGEKSEKKLNNVVIGFVNYHLFYAKRNIIELEIIHPKMKDVYLFLNPT